MEILYLLLFSLFSSFFLLKILIKVAPKLGFLDYPDIRKRHQSATPNIGGTILFVNFFLCLIVLRIIPLNNIISPSFFDITYSLPLSILFISGIINDIKGIKTINKIIIQLLVSFFLVNANIQLFDGDSIIILLINIMFFMGTINTINFIDGLDGLAALLSIIYCTAFFSLFYLMNHFEYINLFGVYIITAMGLISFLYYNLKYKSIFLGDTGSLLLGFLFSISIIYLTKSLNFKNNFLLPFIVYLIPMADLLLVMIFRFKTSSKKTLLEKFSFMFEADRNHIHHLLCKIGYSQKYTLFILVVCAVLTSSIGIVLSYFNNHNLNLFIFVFLLVAYSLCRLFLERKTIDLN